MYFAQGMLDQAAGHYLRALESEVTEAEADHARTWLGVIAYYQQRPADVVALLTPLVETDPRNAEARFYLGATLLDQLQDPEAAIPLFEELLAMPDLAESARTQVEQMLQTAQSMAGGQ